jgi:hypothetical protein
LKERLKQSWSTSTGSRSRIFFAESMPFATPTDDSVPGAFFVDSVLM